MSEATNYDEEKSNMQKKKMYKALDGVLRKGYESPFQRIRHLLWSLGSYLKVSLSISSSRFGNPIYRPEIDSNEVSSSQRKVKNVKKAFAKIFPIKYAQVVVLLQKFSSDIFSEGIVIKPRQQEFNNHQGPEGAPTFVHIQRSKVPISLFCRQSSSASSSPVIPK